MKRTLKKTAGFGGGGIRRVSLFCPVFGRQGFILTQHASFSVDSSLTAVHPSFLIYVLSNADSFNTMVIKWRICALHVVRLVLHILHSERSGWLRFHKGFRLSSHPSAQHYLDGPEKHKSRPPPHM